MTTIDELVEIVINEQRGRDPIVVDAQLFFALAGAAKRAPRWIPVTERLPKMDRRVHRIKVLCSYETIENDKCVGEAWWDGISFESDYYYNAPIFASRYARIIAWQYMPLPALPEEVEG